MKKLILPLLTITLITGCGTKFGQSVDRMLFRPTAFATNQVPEQVKQVTTNQIVVVASTNALGEVTLATNRQPVIINITVPAHQEVKPVGWEANPNATTAISAAGSFIPGYGQLAAWAATAILGIAAAIRSGKYKDAAVSVAQGVEHYMEQNPTAAPSLKTTLAKVQADHGTTVTVRKILANEVESAPKAA
jgi:hypothetical protein